MSDRRRPSWRGANLLYVCRKLGLASGLKLVLDAGDAASLPASSKEWNDLSGNGYHFEFGADHTHPGTDEPAINGTAGQLAAGNYLSFDGGDFLTLGQTNPAWVQNLHKDNAAFTLLVWAYITSTGSNGLMGTLLVPSGSNVGFLWGRNASNKLNYIVRNGTSNPINVSTTDDVLTDQWVMFSISLNESVGAGGAIIGQNLSFESFTSTYATPTASDATFTLQIGTRGGNGAPLQNGSRIGGVVALPAALTQGQIAAFFNATRGRFGV